MQVNPMSEVVEKSIEEKDQVVIPIAEPSDPIARSPVTLSWDHLSYTIFVGKEKTPKILLNNISGIVKPGEVVAIMGASGAGKSTLLNVLAGRIGDGEIKGKVHVNGSPRNHATWRNIIAYVEQDDLMYENLTVRETLEYAALLRLPNTMSLAEKKKKVDQIISELSLSKCQNTKIGGPNSRGISGGERKRVSIGVELVTDPHLLFLDEPTSGLDAFTAMNIIESVKNIAIKGQNTVLTTIHQPREYILSLFDKIILLSEGKLVYVGDLPGAVAHFEKCGFVCPQNTNPSDFFLDTMTIDFRSNELKEKSLERVKRLQESWDNPSVFEVKASNGSISSKSVKSLKTVWNNNMLTEFSILFRRNVKDVIRNPAVIGASFGQAIVTTIILGFVFFRMNLSITGVQNRIGALFFICINQTFSNVMPTIAVFTLQREIIKRERSSGTYRASSAYLAKLLSQIPLVIASALLFAIPVYWMLGLQDSASHYFTFLAIVLIHAITATSLGIAIASGVPSVQVGQIAGPLIIIVFLVFGGQFVNLNSIPAVLRWIKWISLIHYSYAALAQNEFAGLQFACPGSQCTTGETVLHSYSLDDFSSLWINEALNAVILFSFVLSGYFLFQWRSKPLMRLK